MGGSDPEVKATLIVNLATTECDLLSKLKAKFWSWLKLRKAMAIILQLKQILLMQFRLKQYATTKEWVNMEMLQAASSEIITLVENKQIKVENQTEERVFWQWKSLSTLNPSIDKHGIIRVDGRLRRSELNNECRHPRILPKKRNVTDLIVQWCHYNIVREEWPWMW